jgi:chromosome segregation ATPase
MATNGLELGVDHGQAFAGAEKPLLRRRVLENRVVEEEDDFALAPLVDKIAYGIARGLVVAVKELEQHIASETRKVGDSVDRRLDAVQASIQELSKFVGEQRSTNSAVEGRLQELSAGVKEADARQVAAVEALSASTTQRIDAAAAAQKEADARRAAEIAALSQSLSERIDGICKELGVHQEDLSAIKTALGTFTNRVDALVERLDRQAEAVRSMYAAYSQRETELEQVVDGLARLRAFPTPMPANGL